MLPDQYRQSYLEFQQALQHIEDQVSTSQVQESDRAALQQSVQTVQTLYQAKILPLDAAELSAGEAVKIQALQTEISKQLRLLGTDLMFLQTARLSTTIHQRQQQIRDRLTLLQRYCQAVLE